MVMWCFGDLESSGFEWFEECSWVVGGAWGFKFMI